MYPGSNSVSYHSFIVRQAFDLVLAYISSLRSREMTALDVEMFDNIRRVFFSWAPSFYPDISQILDEAYQFQLRSHTSSHHTHSYSHSPSSPTLALQSPSSPTSSHHSPSSPTLHQSPSSSASSHQSPSSPNPSYNHEVFFDPPSSPDPSPSDVEEDDDDYYYDRMGFDFEE